MSTIQAQLDYVEAVADCFLDLAEHRGLERDLEESLRYTYVAATILSTQNRLLSCVRLEKHLQWVAEHLVEEPDPVYPLQTPVSVETTLHVLSEALPAGGLTAMATRWIKNDKHRIHSVALLSDHLNVPHSLVVAVNESGGRIYHAQDNASFVDRARWLRSLAKQIATFVVLHVDVSDVLCGAAFGVNGGPPVLLVNHTAHTFWSGACVADLVVNCRGSALERHWTAVHRGASNCVTVPIPLLENAAVDVAEPAERKRRAKSSIGIPPHFTVLLTVGASFKYLASQELDFVTIYEKLLTDLPSACLVVVGFNGDSRWNAASRKTGFRIILLGTLSHTDLAMVHEAADIYIEGFPFGTTTALLEAGLKGIPVVLPPAPCLPPYASDGIALDDILGRAKSVEDYGRCVTHLSLTPEERLESGSRLRDTIRNHHTGTGWTQHLEGALQSLCAPHTAHCPTITPRRTPQPVHEYWSEFVRQFSPGYEHTLEHAIVRALLLGLRPRFTTMTLRLLSAATVRAASRTMPVWLLGVLCNSVLPRLPIRWRSILFRVTAVLFRRSIAASVFRRVATFAGLKSDRTPYSEYRHVRTGGDATSKTYWAREPRGDDIPATNVLRKDTPTSHFSHHVSREL